MTNLRVLRDLHPERVRVLGRSQDGAVEHLCLASSIWAVFLQGGFTLISNDGVVFKRVRYICADVCIYVNSEISGGFSDIIIPLMRTVLRKYFFFFKFIYFFSEVGRRERGRGRIPSRPCTVSTKPDSGFEPPETTRS